MTFHKFDFHDAIARSLTDNNFTTPTEIQEQAMPAVLAGKDVMACAQTGTGKTAAFVLPILQKLVSSESPVDGRGPRVLILTPTRELAQQVHDNIRLFSRYLHFKVGMLIGGVSYRPQYDMLKRRVDIIVATPGRLIDHMEQNKVDFSRLEVVVLDEADRMLDMGFVKPVESIVSAAPANRQTLFFSATFDNAVEKVAKNFLRSPVRLELAPQKQNNKAITQSMVTAKDSDQKRGLLNALLLEKDVKQAIVFVGTKHGTDRLAKRLASCGYRAAALHGDMKQNARKRTIDAMHKGDIKVLVATDVAARGIDVPTITHVINYDLPQVAEDYVHRIGRTGRAGATGYAISLIGPRDRRQLKQVENWIGQKIPLHARTEAKELVTMDGASFTVSEERKPKRSGFKQNSSDFGGRDGEKSQGYNKRRKPFGKKFEGKKFDDNKSEDGKPEGRKFGSKKFGGKKFAGKKTNPDHGAPRRLKGKKTTDGSFTKGGDKPAKSVSPSAKPATAKAAKAAKFKKKHNKRTNAKSRAF